MPNQTRIMAIVATIRSGIVSPISISRVSRLRLTIVSATWMTTGPFGWGTYSAAMRTRSALTVP